MKVLGLNHIRLASMRHSASGSTIDVEILVTELSGIFSMIEIAKKSASTALQGVSQVRPLSVTAEKPSSSWAY